MYCPSCFGETLNIKTSGLVNIIINGKQMDAGRIIYNMSKDTKVLTADLKSKIEEFFKWYGNFQNKEPIKEIRLISSDFRCSAGCNLGVMIKSIIGILITADELFQLLEDCAPKYNLKIELKKSDLD